MTRYRLPLIGSCDNSPPELYTNNASMSKGLKSIRELAVFRYSCRRCREAPCIQVCPAEALEKDDQGMVMRHSNLCVSCKTCVTACPFGTMMTDFFTHHRQKDTYFNLDDEDALTEFIKLSPEGVAEIVDMDEDPSNNIYKLNDRILIKEHHWDAETQFKE